MRHSIGRFSHELGVNAQTLRYYDRIGLLPVRKADNGYRYYTDSDIRRLMEIRLHRTLGFSLEETRQRLECSTVEDFERTLLQKQRAVDEQIAQLQAIRNRQEDQLRMCRLTARDDGAVGEGTLPVSLRYILLYDGENMPPEGRFALIQQQMMACMPLPQQILEAELDSLQDSDAPLRYRWGLALSEANFPEDVSHPELRRIDAGTRFLYTTASYPDRGGDEIVRALFEPLLSHMRERAMQPSGNAFGLLLPSAYDGVSITRHLLVAIPSC